MVNGQRSSALLKQRKDFHPPGRGRSLAAAVTPAHGQRHVFQSFRLFGKGFKVAAGKGDKRGIERFIIQRTEEGTDAADIVTHGHDQAP